MQGSPTDACGETVGKGARVTPSRNNPTGVTRDLNL